MERAGSSGERWSIKNLSMISAYSATSWLISLAAVLEGAAWWKLGGGSHLPHGASDYSMLLMEFAGLCLKWKNQK